LSIISCISYDTVDFKRQNRVKVGADKPELKVKMQLISDDDVQKKLLEKPHFELAAKGIFRLGRCYIFRQGVPGLWASWRQRRLLYVFLDAVGLQMGRAFSLFCVSFLGGAVVERWTRDRKVAGLYVNSSQLGQLSLPSLWGR